MSCKTCPLFADYRFKTACRVDTCKYYTEKTKNRCMGLDTVFSATQKGITDAELRFLKLPQHTKKDAFIMRQEAKDKLLAIVALHQAVIICKEEMNPDVFPEETPVVAKIMKHSLFYDEDLGMEAWMLSYLLDSNFMKRVRNPKIHVLFGVTEKEFEMFHK